MNLDILDTDEITKQEFEQNVLAAIGPIPITKMIRCSAHTLQLVTGQNSEKK